MENKRRKKHISFLLAVVLSVSFADFSHVQAESLTDLQFQETSIIELEQEKADEKREEGAEEQKNRKVRIIVELEGEPVIQEAIKRGVSYSALSDSFVEGKKEEIRQEQEEAVSEWEDMQLRSDLSDIISYDTVLNAVAMTIDERDIKTIENYEGVKNVFFSQEFERPALHSSKDIIGANYAWNTLGYKGEGSVVAIIDSGIDYTHEALKVDDVSRIKYSKEDIENLISEKNLKGRYFSAKVPYGYNYYDHNHNTFDRYGVMHGMHVAGIVAANGGANDTLYGVAPNAQLLAMKVFSDDLEYPTTFTDIWLKALDDAIALKADVVNMSLGAPAGITHEGGNHPEIEVLEKARKAGVVVAVAAGNEGTITDGNYYGEKPLKENYDTSLIASPSLNEDTISVASMENTEKHVPLVKWKDAQGRQHKATVNLYRPSDAERVIRASVEDIKRGTPEDLTKAVITDRIVMTEVPEHVNTKEFYESMQKVIAKKPKAILLYNTERMGDFLGGRLVIHNELGRFTVGRITYDDYMKISKEKDTPGFQLTISSILESIVNPLAGKMSKFSSWGPTPDLRMKPEITAPGGHIYSTIENDSYRNMSGTSMASPQVAGASAVLKQYLKTKGIEGERASELIKLLLMNTAVPIENKGSGVSAPYFVRQQGAGAMNLEKALKTDVLVRAKGTNDNIYDGKLELKQLDEKKFDVDLSIENFGKEDREYTISVKGLYERAQGGRRLQESALLSSQQNDRKTHVRVEAGATKQVKFQVDYSDAAELEEGNFIEGYLCLAETSKGETCDLNVPFLGFLGEWTAQRAIDAFELPELNSGGREAQFMVNRESNSPSSMFITTKMLRLPVIQNKLYFSPGSVYYDNVGLRLAPLRNMAKVEYSILDGETKEPLRVLGVSKEVRKLSRLSVKPSYRYMPDSLWNGRIGGELIEEGKTYLYQIRAVLNNNGVGSMHEQVYRYPIAMDQTPPEFSQEEKLVLEPLDNELKSVKFKVRDAGSGIQRIYLESVKYVSDSDEKKPPSLLPPGIDPTPPGGKKEEKEGEEKEKKEEKDTIGLKPGQKIKYGKYTKLNFVDSEEMQGKILPKIENGKLVISTTDVPTTLGESGEIFINRNGHTNEWVEVEIPFLCDSTHMMVSAGDFLGHYKRQIIETGVDENYHILSFMNFFNSIRTHKVSVFVNDKKMEHFNIHLKEKNAQVRMELPDDGVHMNLLYLKKGRELIYLIKDGRIDKENAKKYALSYRDGRVEFRIDPLNASYEIITGFKQGKMEQQEEKEVVLDLSKLNREDFKSLYVKNAGTKIDVQQGVQSLTLSNGKTLFGGDFKPLEGKTVIGVALHQENGGMKLLRKRGYFEVFEGRRVGYSASKYSVVTFFELEENTAIEILYKEDEVVQGEQRIEEMPEEKNEEKKEEPPVNEPTEEDKEEQYPDSYPTVWIQTPKLLSVLTQEDAVDEKIHIKGFVGHIRPDDKIEKVELTLVDEDGNVLGEPVIIGKEELKEEQVIYSEGDKVHYNGMGSYFSAEVPVGNFEVNLRAEVVTEGGESASIVRRLFYDAISPTLEYGIFERKLNEDKVIIRFLAKDNSLKLNLYRNDSLIAYKDMSYIRLRGEGVVLEQEIEIPLEKGQNELKFKVVDMAKHEAEKTVYIYRTEE